MGDGPGKNKKASPVPSVPPRFQVLKLVCGSDDGRVGHGVPGSTRQSSGPAGPGILRTDVVFLPVWKERAWHLAPISGIHAMFINGGKLKARGVQAKGV